MTSSQLLAWLSSHWTAVWPAVSAVLLMLLRSRTPEQWVALGETSPRLQGFIRMLRGAGLDPPKVVSGFIQWVTGRVPSRPSAPPAPPSNGQRGSVRVSTLLVLCVVVLALTALGAALTGCPNWNRPACPRAGVYSCVSDQPHVCSPTGELTPIGDEACGLQGRVCSVGDAGVAFCARAADGGVR